jgi:DUF4097 and DUF4098 domain-containing protein YvlB
MRFGWLIFAPVLVSAALGQSSESRATARAGRLANTDSSIRRDGPFWIQTLTGTAPVYKLLRIATSGAVTVQGEERTDLAYTLRKRVKVAQQAHAREVVSGVLMSVKKQGPGTILEVQSPEYYLLSLDLEVRVPLKLPDLKVTTDMGAVQVYDLAGSVYAETGSGHIELDRIRGGVSAGTGGGNVRLGKIGGSAQILSGGGAITADWIGGSADLKTEGGEVYVVSAKGPVRASANGGNIRIDKSEAGVVANAVDGLVDVLDAGGPVVVETGSGSIKVRSAGDVNCRLGSGAIRLYSVYGRLRASTGSGSIVAELLAGKPLEDSAITTGMGDITVYIPSNLPVTVQAINSTPGGHRIISDFEEIRVQREARAGWLASGELSGGGPLLRITAAGGTIYLRRKH